MWIDSHCHLEPEDFCRPDAAGGPPRDERPEVLARARAAGVSRLIVIGSGHGIAEVRNAMGTQITLPPGYWLHYGGTFEQLQSASERLGLLVPLTLLMIFALLLMTFGSAKDAALVFSGVPLALTGGILALWWRGIPLSITAGVSVGTVSRSLNAPDSVRPATLAKVRAAIQSLGFRPVKNLWRHCTPLWTSCSHRPTSTSSSPVPRH